MNALPQEGRQRTPLEQIQVVTLQMVHPRQKVLPDSIGLVSATLVIYDWPHVIRDVCAALRQCAYDMGADAVAATQFFIYPSTDHRGSNIAYAVGTPVLLPWPDGHAAPDEGLPVSS